MITRYQAAAESDLTSPKANNDLLHSTASDEDDDDDGGAENARLENAGLELSAPYYRGWKMRD